MRYQSWIVLFLTIAVGLVGWNWAQGQSLGGGTSASSITNSTTDSTPAPSGMATPTSAAANSSGTASATLPTPVAATTSPKDADDDSDGSMLASDFIVDGAPSAKVLYMEGNVWIRPPGETTFHRLTEDEPIPAQTALYTGYNGILDFATGPGMAIRMVPKTGLRVDLLPQAGTASSAPVASQVSMRKGTIFSALGREDGNPISFQVQTPLGLAGARGTMFSTSASPGQAEVSMLHGTVNFETPDHQTSQITAGQSQQIGSSDGKFHLGQRQALNPNNAKEFFNHAGGLLEHASGYGVVRHGLGPDVAKTLQQRGYKLPAETQQRFQNAGTLHYHQRPGSHAESGHHKDSAESHTGSSPADSMRKTSTASEKEKESQRRHPGDAEWNRKNKDKDNLWGH